MAHESKCEPERKVPEKKTSDFEQLERDVTMLETQMDGALSDLTKTHAKILGKDIGRSDGDNCEPAPNPNRIIALSRRIKEIGNTIEELNKVRIEINDLFE